ncbi:MAG: SUMF1/EgtB/PvdO family nonheme iron enzyme [Deltaproteobacteria bacterium]|nr:SUMF1/EgtB/PvdO family nonheme iron enzyme [Deltaproteobacteria bacterium]
MKRKNSAPTPRRRRKRTSRKAEIPLIRPSSIEETPLTAALQSLELDDAQFVEVISEAEPASTRTPAIRSLGDTGPESVDAATQPESHEHAPWLVEEFEKFAGSRWRFVAVVATLTVLGLLVRERFEVGKWLSSIHFSKPAKAQLVDEGAAAPAQSACPEEMALVGRAETGVRVCVDKWEASLVEILPDGEEKPWSPYVSVDEGHVVKAVSKPGVVPQGYIDRDSAQQACEASGKRLCHVDEWTAACEGPERNPYPYGSTLDEGACNIHGKSPLGELFSTSFKDHLFDFRLMNDPSLNALDGTVAKTGAFDKCANGWGLHDMVGNLHEWTADKNGVFRGGYYQDGHKNGEGCKYATSAHLPTYHDYSTGFRCCKDAE